MSFHSDPINDILVRLGVDQATGLSSEEVLARRKKYGENKLREKKKKTMLQRFLDQFKDVMI